MIVDFGVSSFAAARGFGLAKSQTNPRPTTSRQQTAGKGPTQKISLILPCPTPSRHSNSPTRIRSGAMTSPTIRRAFVSHWPTTAPEIGAKGFACLLLAIISTCGLNNTVNGKGLGVFLGHSNGDRGRGPVAQESPWRHAPQRSTPRALPILENPAKHRRSFRASKS
jgi:hypothetical protein